MKKLLFFILTLLSLFNTSMAQQEIDILLGVEGAVDYGYRELTPNSTDYNKDLYDLRNKAERPAVGYQLGLSSMLIHPRGIMLKLGALYSIKGYNATGPFNNQGITSIDLDLSNFYYFNYIAGHLQLDHIIQFADAQFFYGVGTNFNRFHSATHRTVTYFEDGTINDVAIEDQSRTFKQWTFEGTLQFGIYYDYNDYLTLKAYPIFRYGLSPINENDMFLERLFSGGLHIGLFYSLKR